MYWARYVLLDQELRGGGMRSTECPSSCYYYTLLQHIPVLRIFYLFVVDCTITIFILSCCKFIPKITLETQIFQQLSSSCHSKTTFQHFSFRYSPEHSICTVLYFLSLVFWILCLSCCLSYLHFMFLHFVRVEIDLSDLNIIHFPGRFDHNALWSIGFWLNLFSQKVSYFSIFLSEEELNERRKPFKTHK